MPPYTSGGVLGWPRQATPCATATRTSPLRTTQTTGPSPHRRQPDPPDLAAPSTVRALLVWLVTNVTRALAAAVTPW
ncbi:hypothetical protein [Nonomuraea sp. NPDC049784]|uniref:hypothetical protein n=1 Tax=Nonomuraea sp. NPDC049784 TaxID=3154361 RepID=UPI0033D637D7